MNVIKITMMQLRAEPGEWIHQVYKHNETIIITKAGREVCQISPIEMTHILSNGRIKGQTPLTKNRPELLRR